MQSEWESIKLNSATAIQQPEKIPTVERVYEAFARCDDLSHLVMELAETVCGPAPEGKAGGSVDPMAIGIANQLETRARNSKMVASEAIDALRRIQSVFK